MNRLVRMIGCCALALGIAMGRDVAGAQTCGDADSAGGVTVTDGVQVLRAAAGLSSTCAVATCDVDGGGTVTVTDGVDVLRLAASLPTDVSCGTEVATFVAQVLASGDPAPLQLGNPPAPGAGAPTTITDVEGSTTAGAGGSNAVMVTFDLGGGGAGATLVVAVRSGASLVDGFFELPLDGGQGTVDVTVRYPASLGPDEFMLAFATRDQGVVSAYSFLAQHAGGPTPATTRTPTPVATRTPTPAATATPSAVATLTPSPAPTINPGVGCVQAVPVCFDDPQLGTTNNQTCSGANNTLDQSACTDPQFSFCHYRQCNIDQFCGSADACCPQTCECTGPPGPGNLDCPSSP